MRTPITSQLVDAYLRCPRNAFLKVRGDLQEDHHEYYEILTERASENRNKFIDSIKKCESGPPRSRTPPQECPSGIVVSEDLQADCDAIRQEQCQDRKNQPTREPYIVVGTHSITKEHRTRLAFAGFVIGNIDKPRPKSGYIVPVAGKPQRILLEPLYQDIQRTIANLRSFLNPKSPRSPPLILNEHCATCGFRQHCLQEAEAADNLSLLGRMTPKLIRKYQSKGIFTVTHLSYIFRPRRRRKGTKRTLPKFNVELQALALRTGKIYLEDSPSLPKSPVEIFLDLEGIPDENFYYLIGLIIDDHDTLTEHSLWANYFDDERAIFEEFVGIAASYGDAPIYHYGGYEAKSLRRMQTKYGIDCTPLIDRLVNVNSLIFGKIYFPSRSNRLKDLGPLVGATWDWPDASGLASIAWRMQWERTGSENLKSRLVSYNMSDCRAVRLLVSELRQLTKAIVNQVDVDFADNPRKRTTEEGTGIHNALERIITSAHEEYQRNRICVVRGETASTKPRTRGAPEGHPGFMRIVPRKADKTVHVPSRLTCPSQRHPLESLEPTGEENEHTIIDLKFSKQGCKKVITKFIGEKAHCIYCNRDFVPPAIQILEGRLFGHSFQAWAVYLRVVLRLPYTAITAQIEDLFSERVAKASIVNFVGHMAKLYSPAERHVWERILESPFIHVDETKISIEGVDNYVWVLTDGTHVVFRLTESRETLLVREMLAGYRGVLVSDFYGGYDSVTPRQQKCLVHLTRDLNDDLWKNPFNRELERFVGDIRDLLIPIFDDVERYGLRARHLRKHVKAVERFYRDRIDIEASQCEIVSQYQKRFQRYRGSMFLFLQEDGIPWNNNMAERAIRHLAIQRKISGSFYRPTAIEYLRLLGIAQTCRFQHKSFLGFLLSEEMDVDGYKEGGRPKSSSLMVTGKKEYVSGDR